MILRSGSGQQVLISGELLRCVSEPLRMLQLRRLLYETSSRWRIDLLSDAGVLNGIQQMIKSGKLVLVAEIIPEQKQSGGSPIPKPKMEPPPIQANPDRRQESRQEEPDPDTFDFPLDGALQASVLAAAAANGTAFCAT